jgi:Bacterial PH domain
VPELETSTPAPVSAVPHRLRIICAITAGVVLAVLVVVAVLLKHSSTGVVSFHTSDQVAMIVLGLILGGGILALGRPRVDADLSGVRVRNILATHRLGWDMVRAVRFERSSQWATLLLANGDELAVLAVQASDRERALEAVEGLRALVAATRPPEPPRQPLLYED